LNEFSQGIEHLRIKISFEDVKKIFNYLDSDMDGKICVGEFKLLSEDVWRNIDPLQHYLSNIQNASKKKETS
jgi:hypothetical protein